MERMTQVIDGSVIFPQKLVGVTLTPDNQIMHRMLNRLASYEDTGLEPEEIKAIMLGSAAMSFENLNGYPVNELIRLYKAEQEGHLVVLDMAPEDSYGGLKRKYIVFKSDRTVRVLSENG